MNKPEVEDFLRDHNGTHDELCIYCKAADEIRSLRARLRYFEVLEKRLVRR